MNCERVREELELGFGTGSISAEAAEHLKECETCLAYQHELDQLAPSLGHDENFALSKAEIERAVRAVERRIEPERAKNVISFGWFSPVVRAVAAVLVLAFAYGAYELGRMHGDTAPVEFAQTTVDTGYGSVGAFMQSQLDGEMDDGMVSAIIRDYSANTSLGASDALLDDISVEELEYLKKNLEVGDML